MSEIPQPPQIPEAPIERATPSSMSSLAKAGLWTMLAGVVIAFSPIAIAFFSTLGGNMYDETGGGAALWLLFMTIPLGFITGIVGLVLLIVGVNKKS